MEIDAYRYGASDLAALTDLSPLAQRELRHRGAMEGYGKIIAGRFMYSIRDLIGVTIGDRLVLASKMHRRPALLLGRLAAENVISAFHDVRRSQPIRAPRFLAQFNDGFSEGMKPFGSSIAFVANIEDLDGYEFDHLELVDIWRLGKTLPGDVAAQLVFAEAVEAE